MLYIFICLFAAVQLVQAQDTQDSYQGVWEFSSPESGSFVLILKRNGLASYFRSDNQDRTVYQGSWETLQGDAVATLPDGLSYRITKDTGAFSITSRGNTSAQNFKAYTQRLPKETLGQWAKGPQSDEDFKSDKDEAKGFFGIWKIGLDAPFYVMIESDRSAASNWDGSLQGERGMRGAWARQGSELHIVWDSGHYSILRETERGFSYKRIEPGQIIEDDSSTPITCTRVDATVVPEAWMAGYKEERETYTGGIAFASRKSAREFYRGYWLIKLGEQTYERFEIGRFGGLSTSRNSDLKGDWGMSGQDLYLRWDDGMRKILSPVGEGFIIYEYRPGRPLDGVPSRVFPTAPENTAKLAEYVRGRNEVARQLAERAEEAGVNLKDGNYGFGRTFMRWAWPFGAEEADDADVLIKDAYEESYSADPWWWPFWSEKQPEAAETSEAETPVTEVAAETTKPAAEAAAKESTPAPKQLPGRSKDAWYWPF